MTAPEIAEALGEGKDPSNVRRDADAMEKAGLLTKRRPTRSSTGPGRRATMEFRLASGKAKELEQYLAAGQAPGLLRPPQQLVFARAAAPQLEDLFNVLADSDLTARASWAALWDGEPQEYVIAFDGAEAAAAALDLLAALSASQIQCRRTAVTQVELPHRLVERAKRRARAATRARLRRNTRRTSSG